MDHAAGRRLAIQRARSYALLPQFNTRGRRTETTQEKVRRLERTEMMLRRRIEAMNDLFRKFRETHQLWVADCKAFWAKLKEVDARNRELKDHLKVAIKHIKAVDEELLQDEQNTEKIIPILLAQTRLAHIRLNALQEAYNVLPALRDKLTLKQLLHSSEDSVRRCKIEQEVATLLKEAGVESLLVGDIASSQTPDATPSQQSSANEVMDAPTDEED
ncbi:hypothetical protein FALBO_2694 [Fusarium albosuccineum]|uniref:Uncharacterized protein n=1 Tax=Fusarium albosuccineum TaxID=1237068 RepID=A0A8H4LMP9_9HYPO|nr:hypothetical protein FALBO_2694 [Fusarium albosuccineum]